MKKFLALILILVMASYAGATVINMQVKDIIKGEGNTLADVQPSDIVVIKIVTDVYLDAYDFDIHVTGPGTLMEVDGGPAYLDRYWSKPPTSGKWYYYPLNRQGADNSLFLYSGITANGIVRLSDAMLEGQFSPLPEDGGPDLVWGLAIHCDGPGDVIIDLTQGAGSTGGSGILYGNADYGDLVIHQVPEPLTLSLLGLGGLGLIRRRRA